MMWDQVLIRLVDIVETDSTLVSIFGDNMRMSGSGEFQTPALEWTLIADSESELWAPCIIQFDVWHADMGAVTRAERRLRALFHSQLPIELDDLIVWAEYQDGNVLATPDRNNFNGRGLRFKFTPLRSRYALSSENLLTP